MARRNSDHLSISEVLKTFVHDNKLETGLDQVAIADTWRELMGNGVNSHTRGLHLEGDILYVQLDSSVLREELIYAKTKIITMLNDALGKSLVRDIVLR